LITLIGWDVCSHFVSHVLKQSLWRANLEIAFGFFASRFWGIRGAKNRRPSANRQDKQNDKFSIHSGRLITQRGWQGYLFQHALILIDSERIS
jgi:hypothetical protein